jgi:hypothetical protein
LRFGYHGCVERINGRATSLGDRPGGRSPVRGVRFATDFGMADPRWKCTICGLVGAAAAPPAHCPECGALAEMFVPTDEPPHGIPHNPLQPHDERDQTSWVVGPGHGCLEND